MSWYPHTLRMLWSMLVLMLLASGRGGAYAQNAALKLALDWHTLFPSHYERIRCLISHNEGLEEGKNRSAREQHT